MKELLLRWQRLYQPSSSRVPTPWYFSLYILLTSDSTYYRRTNKVCGKVMFSQVSVNLFTGEWVVPPPRTVPLWDHTPSDHNPRTIPPRTILPWDHTSLGPYPTTKAGGTHPAGMLSCWYYYNVERRTFYCSFKCLFEFRRCYVYFPNLSFLVIFSVHFLSSSFLLRSQFYFFITHIGGS